MTKLKGQSDPAEINKYDYNRVLKAYLLIIIFYTETDVVC